MKAELNLEFVDRVMKTTLILAAFLFPFLTVYGGTEFALSVLFGAVWGVLNLLAIKIVIVNLLRTGGKNLKLGLLVLFFKMPVLYGIGYFLVTWDYLSIVGLLWGFSGILIVSFLKAIGRSYLGLDNKVNTEGTKA